MPALHVVLALSAAAFGPGEDPAAPAGRAPNRLVHEESAYLRQHATNPVDWYPWGEEAFSKAAEEGKPIFLSIGYSTCHWCHVMERESFEDEAVAAVLNEHFVPIKVDREERPDVDSIYMTFVQARTGSGGWPLNVFLTPARVPFFGGTYFPPERTRGMASFREVLERVVEVWEDDRAAIERDAETVARFLRERSAVPPAAGALDASILDATVSAFAERFDETWGGTAGAPKFPAPRALQLLLRHEHRTGSARALEMVVTTLDRMAAGGIHDQLGGGFARYAVDARWRVPHFEKMLYDNAQLARVYAEAHQRTGAPRFAAVARGVLDYLLRDMRLEGGAFAAAEDADSEGEEGRFYTWTPDEVRVVLGDEGAKAALAYYGVTEDGHLDGRSVLHVADPKALAGAALEAVRRRLLEARASRERPLRDDKVLAGWNGLAISAFAYAGRALDEPRYVAAARDAAAFLLERLDLEDGLRRRLAGGEAEIHGHLSDHAFLAQGLLDLYESDLDPRWLDAALDLTDRATEIFLDPESGTFFDVPAGRDDLLVRPRDATDDAVPSGTAVHVKNLLRLAELTMDDGRRVTAMRCLEAYAGAMARVGLAYVELVNALGVALAKPREVVFAGERGAGELEALIRAYWSAFRPYRVIAHAPADAAARAAIAQRLPLVEGRTPVDGAAAAYLCEDYACRLPITDPAELE